MLCLKAVFNILKVTFSKLLFHTLWLSLCQRQRPFLKALFKNMKKIWTMYLQLCIYSGIIWMINFQVIFLFFLPPSSAFLPEFPVTSPFPGMCSGGSERLQTKGPGDVSAERMMLGQDKNCKIHRKTSASPAHSPEVRPPLKCLRVSIRLLSFPVLLPSKMKFLLMFPKPSGSYVAL